MHLIIFLLLVTLQSLSYLEPWTAYLPPHFPNLETSLINCWGIPQESLLWQKICFAILSLAFASCTGTWLANSSATSNYCQAQSGWLTQAIYIITLLTLFRGIHYFFCEGFLYTSITEPHWHIFSPGHGACCRGYKGLRSLLGCNFYVACCLNIWLCPFCFICLFVPKKFRPLLGKRLRFGMLTVFTNMRSSKVSW